MKRSGGFRRKTRHKLKKNIADKGKISIRQYMQKFAAGERVLLKAEPAYQRGMYFPAFHGKTGVVMEKQGDCYAVKIQDKNKSKILIVHPVHLIKRQ